MIQYNPINLKQQSVLSPIRTSDRSRQSKLPYNEAFNWAYNIEPVINRPLSPAEIEHHRTRIADYPDKPLSAIFRTKSDICHSLGLPLAGKDTRVCNSMVYDLLTAAASNRFVGISQNKNTYSDKKYRQVSFTNMKTALKLLEKVGLAYVFRVPQSYAGNGVCSFAAATPKLIEETAHLILVGGSAEYCADGALAVMHLQNNRTIALPRTGANLKMMRELRSYNSFMEACQLTYSPFEYSRKNKTTGEIESFNTTGRDYELARLPLRRIFNDRGNGIRDLSNGGRMYGADYQNIHKEKRNAILINGLQTVELDYSEFHINMIRFGIEKTFDPNRMVRGAYDFDSGVEGIVEHRSINKVAVVVGVNAKTKRSAIGAIAKELVGHIDRDLTGQQLFKNAEQIFETALKHNPDLAPYLGRDMGVKLQALDSKIALQILADGVRNGQPILNLHDGFMTTVDNEKYLDNLRFEALEKMLPDMISVAQL